MLKSILASLALVGSITAKSSTTTYDYDAPTGCETSVSFQSCVQPATAIDGCSDSDTPCSCSAEDLARKCQLKYCSGVSYTASFWMRDCTGLGYTYIATNGDYITAPVKASATRTASTATATEASSADTGAASSAASSEASSAASSEASSAASSPGSTASAGAGSTSSGSSPTPSSSTAAASSKPNAAGRAMGFPAGGLLALLATAAGAMVGMLLL